MNTSTPNDMRDSSSQELLEFEGNIDPSIDISDGGEILIISNDQSYLTHGIHKFPAKFFPELPRYLIQKYSVLGEAVLDPMCGSGTVVLEAMLNNRIGIGIDIDPIARLISKVKTTPIDPGFLINSARNLVERIHELDSLPDYQPSIPDFHYRENWFRPFASLQSSVRVLTIYSRKNRTTLYFTMSETSSGLYSLLSLEMFLMRTHIAHAQFLERK